jgi:dCMP deaminase
MTEVLDRPDWMTWFMRLAYVTAERGSCRRKQVGAIIVRDSDKRIVAGGYNGAPRGMPDCLEVGCDVRVIDGRESCVRTLHAESNALDLAGKLQGDHTLFSTVIPCRLCALRIIQAGIKSVVYAEYYESQGTKEVMALFMSPLDPKSDGVYEPRVILTQLIANEKNILDYKAALKERKPDLILISAGSVVNNGTIGAAQGPKREDYCRDCGKIGCQG